MHPTHASRASCCTQDSVPTPVSPETLILYPASTDKSFSSKANLCDLCYYDRNLILPFIKRAVAKPGPYTCFVRPCYSSGISSNMAEALAIIGLTSALVQFVDFGTKVIRQLRRLEGDMEDMPLVFRNVRSRLPLMLDVVRKLMLQMDAGMVQQESQETMLPVVRNCVAQAEQLDALIGRALPIKNESAWSRGKKAIIGVIAEPEIERIDAALKLNFDLLAQSGTFQLAKSLDASKTKQSMFDMSGSTVNLTLLQKPEQKTLDMDTEHLPPYKHAICMAPFPRDANFLGRNATLELIQKTFEERNVIALSGLGGIG